MTYRYGRRAPKNAPALRLSNLLTGTIPAHPATADHLNIGGWQMLGNDQYGDCVAVTWANVRRLMTRQAGAERYPSMDEVTALYKTQNPGFPAQDDGMDIQTCLEYLVKSGGPDGVKAVAFAKVDVSNLDEVKAAQAIFGYLWTGINVQNENMDDFDAGRPWDYHAHGSLDGGHSIISGGYDSDNAGGDVRFVTWAQETAFTDSFWKHLTEEVWVAIWPEHFTSPAFLEGVNVDQLAADYKALTGRDLPTPAPTPQPPTPTPTPAPVGSSVTFTADQYAALAKWAGNRTCAGTAAARRAWKAATA